MSHAGPMPSPNLHCRECGAVNDPGASECWLCQRRDWRQPHRSPTSPKPAPASTSVDAWPIIGLVLGLVLVGAVAVAPGLIIVLMIFVLPAWGGAEWVAYRRRRRGLPTSTARKIGCILVLTIVIPVLLCAALFIALWLICMVNGPPNM
jgi:hypothetical protein